MRFVRKVFWEGCVASERSVCESPARCSSVRTIVLAVGGGVDGLWKGMKIKVSDDVPCTVLTKLQIRHPIIESVIAGSAHPIETFARLLYSCHLGVVMAPEGPRPPRLAVTPIFV